ncbi:hypothetical protein [Kitasatospora mediocidica]|uniref:hypothetical protein n=1 Tax=Kitasatospora mediocidica TaxID=58352 RepID=UPI00055F5904|nr:hypothetical protein [Kitasatospora mediocidica]
MLKRLALTVLVAAAATLTVQPLAYAATGGTGTGTGTGAVVDCTPGGGSKLMAVRQDVTDSVAGLTTNGPSGGQAGVCGDTSWGG